MRYNIAILTHNALEYTRICLAAIAAHTHIAHNVFVLDNASSDDTPQWLARQSHANLRVMLSQFNLGVAGGRNLLLREIVPYAPADSFIIFLDNDVEVYEGWYEPFVELFDNHPEAGIAGATGHKIIVHPEERELLASPSGEPAPVDIVSGFCFWVRAETARAVGAFDENLGRFWHEDDDYCIRAIGLGYEVFAVPNTAMTHYGHKSGVADTDILQGGSPENQRYLADKWRELGLVDSEGRIIHVSR
jgi:O-antigen biosynthesis protein